MTVVACDIVRPVCISRTTGGFLATFANALSFSRMLAVPFIIILLLVSEEGSSTAATIVFILAALTDLLDGILARRTGTVTALGKVIDPLADRTLIGGTVITLAVVGSLPAFGVAIVVARDIFLLIGYKALERRGVILHVSMLGKIYTAIFMFAIVAAMAGARIGEIDIGLWLFWMSVAGSLVSAITYSMKGLSLLKARRAV